MSKGARNIDLCFTIFKEPISTIASVTLQTGGQVEAPPTELKIGAIMTDGTVYAGLSPDTNQPMYTTPRDASLTMTFNQAKIYAAIFGAHGHQDWRVPTKNELNVLFNNRAAIGGFDTTGWHWSSSPYILWFAWRQRFGDGGQNYDFKVSDSSVRLVR
jgi:hypothetical protein